ncbi:MAG: methyltransferase, partial [Lachnospiraceae bacterium]|nr:methyltransferase [Lachnospiraceae bacterium]
MSLIDITEWQEFSIGSLFDIINGKGITKNELYEHSGTIPAIQSGEENNGCIGFIDENYCIEKGYHICKEACLTVARSGSSGHITYQENGCVCGDSAKILKPKMKLSRKQFLFMRTVLMVNKQKYHYNDKVNEKRYASDIIFLPVDAKGNPDWNYMENYIDKLELSVCNLLEQLQNISKSKKEKINVQKYKRFHLYDDDLFTINCGTKLDKIRMSNMNPSINFVGRANANNGVTAFIDKIEGLPPYPAGYLTVSLGGEYLGSCFVQEKPFYTSQNVDVLIPKHDMSKYS